MNSASDFWTAVHMVASDSSLAPAETRRHEISFGHAACRAVSVFLK